MNPTVRSFSTAIEVNFEEGEEMPQELKPWWMETRTNLDRLVDRVKDLETGETAAGTALKALSAPAQTQVITSGGNAADLFDPNTDAYNNARIDFLSALHD